MNPVALQRAAKIELYRRDFTRYCSEQVTILPKIGPPQKLTLWPMQLPIEEVCARQWKDRGYIRVVVFKARQRGGTTYSVARATWQAYLNPNISAIVISCDDPSTANAFNKARLIYEEMDKEIQPVGRYYTKNSIVLEAPIKKTKKEEQAGTVGLRSRIELQTAKNMNAGVSTTRQVIALSEMPRWGRTEEIRSSLLPTLPDGPGTILINEATPFGWGKGRDEFREWCDEARSGKGEYELVELFWWMDPECRVERGKNQRLTNVTGFERYWRDKLKLDAEQVLYMRYTIAKLGKSDIELGQTLFLQEYPSDYDSAWVALGQYAAFNTHKIEKLTANTIRQPIAKREFEIIKGENKISARIVKADQGALWIWEEPKDGEDYDIGADVAPPSTSHDSDYCAFQIIKRSNKEQVAEWYGHPGVYDYAQILCEIGRVYHDAHLAIEVNGIGYAVNEAVVNAGYPNIYRWRLRQQAAPKYSSYTGWKTQDDTKKLMLATMYDMIDHGALLIHSKRLRDEMKMYVKYFSEAGNEKYEAGEGHDDGLDSFMIAQVVSRDEDALGNRRPIMVRAEMGTLAERNAAIEDFMKRHQPGMTDSPMLTYRGKNDAWARLANEFGLRGADDD